MKNIGEGVKVWVLILIFELIRFVVKNSDSIFFSFCVFIREGKGLEGRSWETLFLRGLFFFVCGIYLGEWDVLRICFGIKYRIFNVFRIRGKDISFVFGVYDIYS